MFKITSNAEEVFANLRAKFADKKGLLKKTIEEQLRELFPHDDLSRVEVALTETDEENRFNVTITGLTPEQAEIWDQRQK